MRVAREKFDYTNLNNVMEEHRYSQTTLADAIKISRTSMNLKLNNKSNFTQSEISKMVNILQIPDEEVGDIFFKAFVRKTEQIA